MWTAKWEEDQPLEPVFGGLTVVKREILHKYRIYIFSDKINLDQRTDNMQNLEVNLNHIRQRIAAACASVGRDVNSVTLVAVSKTVGVEAVQEAVKLGITDFGENRVSELVNKRAAVPNVRWHMIGRLQTNKVKEVIDKAYLIHSLDRWNLAEALQKRAEMLDITVPVLLQVNISGEEQKLGFLPLTYCLFCRLLISFPALRLWG